jgi:drug/metabolite transporter (DMT)-like permease
MMALAVFIRKEPLPSLAQWPHLLIGGALVHGITLAPAHVALITVDAAPLALVHAFHPVLTAAIAVILLKKRFTRQQWAGMLLGLAGVVLAFPFSGTSGVVIGLVGLSLAGLTGGTLYLKYFTPDIAPFPATANQLIAGAIACVIGVVLFETPYAVWTPTLIVMMGWNIVMISIVGMAIYSLMLVHGQAGRAASAFFIVPGSAAILAWVFLIPDTQSVSTCRASFGQFWSMAGVAKS